MDTLIDLSTPIRSKQHLPDQDQTKKVDWREHEAEYFFPLHCRIQDDGNNCDRPDQGEQILGLTELIRQTV